MDHLPALRSAIRLFMAARWRFRLAPRALLIPDVEKPNDELPLDRPVALGGLSSDGRP